MIRSFYCWFIVNMILLMQTERPTLVITCLKRSRSYFRRVNSRFSKGFFSDRCQSVWGRHDTAALISLVRLLPQVLSRVVEENWTHLNRPSSILLLLLALVIRM